MPPLPDVDEPEAFDRLLFQPGRWEDAIEAIRDRHGLTESFAQSTAGSTVVFLSARWCIKLHPPLPGFVASHHREVAALRCIHGRLPIATPELLSQGTLDDWNYFVSTRLPGRPIESVWDGLSAAERLELAGALGDATRALHRVAIGPVAKHSEPWAEFRRSARSRCLALERSKGLSRDRLTELERYLQRLDRIAEPSPSVSRPASLLHTEIGPSHVLVDEGHISGLIDFGDAMVGDPEYDLAPVGLFVTRGDAAAFRAFCLAYGLDAAALADPERPTRLLRHALLHRYGTLAWYLDTLAPPPGSLDDLAAHWFGVGEV